MTDPTRTPLSRATELHHLAREAAYREPVLYLEGALECLDALTDSVPQTEQGRIRESAKAIQAVRDRLLAEIGDAPTGAIGGDAVEATDTELAERVREARVEGVA